MPPKPATSNQQPAEHWSSNYNLVTHILDFAGLSAQYSSLRVSTKVRAPALFSIFKALDRLQHIPFFRFNVLNGVIDEEEPRRIVRILFHPAHGLKIPSLKETGDLIERYGALKLHYINLIKQNITPSNELGINSSLARGLIAQGEINLAREISPTRSYYRDKVLEALVTKMIRAHLYSAAWQFSREEFDEPYTQVELQCSIYAKNPTPERFKEIGERIAGLSGKNVQSIAQLDWVSALLLTQEFAAAKAVGDRIEIVYYKICAQIQLLKFYPDLINQIKEAIKVMPDHNARKNLEIKLQSAQIQNGRTPTVLDIEDEKLEARQEIWVNILLCQGDAKGAEAVISKMEPSMEKRLMINSLFHHYYALGNYAECSKFCSREYSIRLIEGFLSINDIQNALKIFNGLKYVTDKVNGIKAFIDHGDLTLALELIERGDNNVEYSYYFAPLRARIASLNGNFQDEHNYINRLRNGDRAEKWTQFFGFLFRQTSSIKFPVSNANPSPPSPTGTATHAQGVPSLEASQSLRFLGEVKKRRKLGDSSDSDLDNSPAVAAQANRARPTMGG